MGKSLFGSALLLFFWLALSGEFHETFLLLSGIVSVVGLVVFMARRGSGLLEWRPKQVLLALVSYFPWLCWQVLVANLRVILLVWHPRLPIHPRLIRVPCPLKTELGRALYANSITLTPGTVSIALEDDVVVVHALTAHDARGLEDQGMLAKIQRLEAS